MSFRRDFIVPLDLLVDKFSLACWSSDKDRWTQTQSRFILNGNGTTVKSENQNHRVLQIRKFPYMVGNKDAFRWSETVGAIFPSWFLKSNLQNSTRMCLSRSPTLSRKFMRPRRFPLSLVTFHCFSGLRLWNFVVILRQRQKMLSMWVSVKENMKCGSKLTDVAVARWGRKGHFEDKVDNSITNNTRIPGSRWTLDQAESVSHCMDVKKSFEQTRLSGEFYSFVVWVSQSIIILPSWCLYPSNRT